MNEGNANVLFLNRGEAPYLSNTAPDGFVHKPSSGHILCRDQDGVPTAVYGSDRWDFNPYRLSASYIGIITFHDLADSDDDSFNNQLVEETKYILYLLIYFSASGHVGRMSASTLNQYYFLLRKMVRFCVTTLDNDLASGITLFDLLSNSAYLRGYLWQKDLPPNQSKQTSALLSALNQIHPDVLGFESCPKKLFNFERKEDRQHPVIPLRIYISIINHFERLAELVYPVRENLRNLLFDLKEPLNGLSTATQKDRGIRSEPYHPTMAQLIERHGLEELMYQTFEIHSASRASVALCFKRVQYALKMVIHLFTGMRHEECARMNYGCLGEERISDPVVADDGTILDASRMVSLVTTHTKFTGYRKSDTWLAPDSVVNAVKVLESIVEGLAHLWGREPEECPLLLSPGKIAGQKRSKFTITAFKNHLVRGEDPLLSSPDFRITKDDLYQLSHTDPDSDFSQDPAYQEGEFWPLTSHQFRRSLAFYAANSGLVSIRTVSHQFKHAAKLMSQYYARNNQNFLSIFGRWDEQKNRKVMPSTHIAQDFQIAVPTAAVDQLFDDVFGSESTLMGGTGSYLEKLKYRVSEGEIPLLKAKDETMKMAEKGEIAYRMTLLGGCTKVGPCNDFLLGDLTACLSCAGANIREDKLLNCLSKAEAEMDEFPEGSAEHQIAKMEVTKLADFKAKKLIKVSQIQ